ncbi:hypothetical protein DUI87_00005 [Hirundo rustica rustica]|uniref:Uncharacterized protein n=1 Tax=Hirundo rustica rustica TaxID=333673 RepID=A0A3M0LC47_HIRRU|nr:hypothetical protein DUI87_00005 [Hirundo rustica rustica]
MAALRAVFGAAALAPPRRSPGAAPAAAPARGGLDLSGTPVTYGGLDNLVSLAHLAHLDLSGCPHLSDWALGRLHVFSGTLQHLALARCPQVSERGLAALHHLSSLRSLDLSGIPVPSPGRFRALLEAALPGCRILGLEEPRE